MDQVAPVLFQKPWLTFKDQAVLYFHQYVRQGLQKFLTTFKGLNVKSRFVAGMSAGTRRIKKKDSGYMK